MKKKKSEKTVSMTTAILIITIVVFSIVAYTFVFGKYGLNYQKAISSENSNDICQTPAGYTDAEWQEHMSHHPDRYQQCF